MFDELSREDFDLHKKRSKMMTRNHKNELLYEQELMKEEYAERMCREIAFILKKEGEENNEEN